MRLLLEAKCSVKVRSRHNIMTPLVWAARKGFETIVGILLEAKADVENRSEEGGNFLPVWIGLEALNEAAKKGHTKIVKALARSREERVRERELKLHQISSGAEESFGF